MKELQQLNIQADLVILDVTKPTTIEKAAKEINDTYSHLDILINNAGAAFDNWVSPVEIMVATHP